MRFFHKYIIYFYITPLVIGSIFYLVYRSTGSITILYLSLGLFMLGIALLCYASWFKVIQIYRDFIYESPELRAEIKYRCATELGFEAEYKEEKKFKKTYYKKSQIINIALGIVSTFLLIYIIVRLFA